jgi:hypothetical protein
VNCSTLATEGAAHPGESCTAGLLFRVDLALRQTVPWDMTWG